MSITWEKLSDKLVSAAEAKRIPLVGQLELTARCNLKCRMCYVCIGANDREAVLKEPAAREWIKLAEEARDAGMLYLLLTGGEIFLRQDFKEIYEEIALMGFNTQLYTNGTLITPEVASWLGTMPPSKIEVTLYGASPETYAEVTGNPDAFRQAIRGVDLLMSEGIALKLRTTVIRSNSGDFDKLMEIAGKRGLELGIANYVSPRREGDYTHPEVERLSAQEFVEYEEHMNKYLKKDLTEASGSSQTEQSYPEDSEEESFDYGQEEYTDSPFQCSAGRCMFWVTWDGKMTPCGDAAEPAAYPFKEGFHKAWAKLQELCSGIADCTECRQCGYKEVCLTCPARLKSETGYYDKPAAYLCEMAKAFKNYKKLNGSAAI